MLLAGLGTVFACCLPTLLRDVPPVNNDAAKYLSLALDVYQGRGFTFDGTHAEPVLVGWRWYPLLFAAAWRLLGVSVAATARPPRAEPLELLIYAVPPHAALAPGSPVAMTPATLRRLAADLGDAPGGDLDVLTAHGVWLDSQDARVVDLRPGGAVDDQGSVRGWLAATAVNR